jgi:hypothetical protein
MKVHFGPEVHHHIKQALYYATLISKDSIPDQFIGRYDQEDNNLFTYILDGVLEVENIKVNVRRTDKVHSCDHMLAPEVYGYFEADNVEIIQSFFERADTYVKNLVSSNKSIDKIKVLKYEYVWECDCHIKKKTFGSIHLPAKVLNDFKTDINSFLSEETQKRYEVLELTPSRIYGLYGPPGTGKTTLIHTTASHYSMNIATLSFDVEMNDRTFRAALKKIPTNTILCLEDIDALFREDRKSVESSVTFSGIINALDGVTKLKNLIIFVTTNHLDKLDPALKRRVDYFVKFDFCTKEQIQEMFHRFLPDENFETFWAQCKKMKLTPSILQKFFVIHMHKRFEDYYHEIKDFVESEHGLEKLPDMYT